MNRRPSGLQLSKALVGFLINEVTHGFPSVTWNWQVFQPTGARHCEPPQAERRGGEAISGGVRRLLRARLP